MNDLRYAARTLVRRPGSTLLTVVLLALGIGSITAVFTLYRAVSLQPLPVRNPNELVRLVQYLPRLGARSDFPHAYYEALRSHSTTLASVFGDAGEYEHFVMSSPAPPQQITLRAVTPEFFSALGVHALLGRVLLPDDENSNSETPPAVLGYGFWRERFHEDSLVVQGKPIIVDGQHFVVVGVMPQDFHGLSVDSAPDLWIPFSAYKALVQPGGIATELELAGRLKPGISLSQSEAECLTVWQSAMKDYYQAVENRPEKEALELVRRGVQLEPLGRGLSMVRDSFDKALKLLLLSLGLLVVIVCFNIGGILLARAAAREQEFAVRLAIGASQFRLVRQVLAESLLLAVLGFAGGILITFVSVPLIVNMLPPMRNLAGTLVPLSLHLQVNLSVFAFALLIAVAMMVIFSISPVISLLRKPALHSLLYGARTSTNTRTRQVVILVQVALSTFLLIVAGLFVRTLERLQMTDPGFDGGQIATFTGDLTGRSEADARAFLETLMERVRQIPGVHSVALSTVGLMRGRGISWTIAPTGAQITRAEFLDANANNVSLEYFATMGMKIVSGRGFMASDEVSKDQASPAMAVVNQAFVERFFPNVEPIGKHFGTGINGVANDKFQIIGVVGNARYRSLREPMRPTFYTFWTPKGLFILNVRTGIRPEAIIAPVQESAASLDPTFAFLEVHTMAEEIRDSLAIERIMATLATVFGIIAGLFVGAGIYGVLAFLAAQRRREIGIRLALGAHVVHIARCIAGQIFVIIGGGIILGFGGAFLAAPAIRSMLYGLSAADPASLVTASLLILVVAALATVVPVLRALHVRPADALRYEH